MQADKQKVTPLLKTAKGQIEGILRMIDDDRYCMDISTQLLSVISILKNANNHVLHAHMSSCVKDAVKNGNADEKIDEILALINKLSK